MLCQVVVVVVVVVVGGERERAAPRGTAAKTVAKAPWRWVGKVGVEVRARDVYTTRSNVCSLTMLGRAH